MTTYDNSSYWQSLHQQAGAKLSTVGWSSLSESFNTLKYRSEAQAVTAVLEEISPLLEEHHFLNVLDVGAGIGYWTEHVQAVLEQKEFSARYTALDISPVALAGLSARLPHVEMLCHDLKTISTDLLHNHFHLVYSFYCLHHLTQLEEFTHALRFAAHSVTAGGVLLIMDPILTMPYSPHDGAESQPGRTGAPRHLQLLDDILRDEGFTRIDRRPAVSFILNSPIEAPCRHLYRLAHALWRLLMFFYRSDKRTGWISRLVIPLDRWCKRHQYAYSSSLCAYRKGDSHA
jgi:SAM-dependent methyltransferase